MLGIEDAVLMLVAPVWSGVPPDQRAALVQEAIAVVELVDRICQEAQAAKRAEVLLRPKTPQLLM